MFKVGYAEIDITPRVGVPLMGNFRDDYAARGVHDPLFAKAIVLSNSKNVKVALLALDICALGFENVAVIRKFISSNCDIPYSNIVVAAIHIHSGPSLDLLGGLPKADESDIKILLEKAASAVIKANNSLCTSDLFFGTALEDRVSFNRRLRCKDNQTHMNWEQLDPDFVVEALGPIDPQVSILTVQQDNVSKAALFNFALHPAILAGDNWLYSADYPACLAQAMRGIHGNDFVTLFFNGCCGNVNHIDCKDKTQGRGYQMAQRIGYMLAVAGTKAMKQQLPVSGDTLAVSVEKVALERLKITEQRRQWCLDVLEKARTSPSTGMEDGLPNEYFANVELEMYGKQKADALVEVTVIRVGDLAIVGLPEEIFCEYGLEIKKESPAKHTIVIELANGGLAYVPTKKAFKEGGYEPLPGSTFYTDTAGERLVSSALKQLKNLF